MPEEVLSPLKNIIERLAATEVQGRAAQMKKRFVDCSDAIVVLCDCSGSMEDGIGGLSLSKFEHLKIALEDILQTWPQIKLVAFASSAKVVAGPNQLPPPGGGTNMARALQLAATFRPRKTIVISDGLPDHAGAALAAAQAVAGSIDTIYCGPDEHPAVDFLRQLSRECAGNSVVWDGVKTGITYAIRGLLPAPVE